MTLKYPFSHFKVSGNSMYPTLKEGEHLFTFNFFYTPKINDLVVARVNKRLIIKRIKKLKKGEVFLEGDNPDHSTDSRSFGWIERSYIIGKVFLVYN